jgi:hypothetical protein
MIAATVGFDDGPAFGVTLSLARQPRYLRVTSKGTEWDALDQLADTPEPGETVYAYAKHGQPFTAHVDFGRRRRGEPRSAWISIVRYRMVRFQPDEATMRDNEAWRAWCLRQEREAE